MADIQEYLEQLEKKVLVLQKKLDQTELSLRLLEEAKDRYDRIYNSVITTLFKQKVQLYEKNRELENAFKEIKILKLH